MIKACAVHFRNGTQQGFRFEMSHYSDFLGAYENYLKNKTAKPNKVVFSTGGAGNSDIYIDWVEVVMIQSSDTV